MSKKISLDECKTTKDIAKFCDANGLYVKRVSGGHAIRGNDKGSFPLSTHCKEMPTGTLKAIKKQITALLAVCVALFVAFQFMV